MVKISQSGGDFVEAKVLEGLKVLGHQPSVKAHWTVWWFGDIFLDILLPCGPC